MTKTPQSVVVKGRSLGIVALTVTQLLIGIIHIVSGLWLISYELTAGTQVAFAYDVYTIVFGLSVLVFAFFVWRQKRIGWAGTIAVSLFVIAADGLTLLNLPSIPGIPKEPALAEIGYSVVIVLYLCTDVRRKFLR